jgi:hypothetical protein
MSRAAWFAAVADFQNAKVKIGRGKLNRLSPAGKLAGMAPQFIPSGRTSIIEKGELKFQLQTEYAAKPQPRITTTIFSEGQVLHKVERAVEKGIETFEEMHIIEDFIKAQHFEISKVIREQGLPTAAGSDEPEPRQPSRSVSIRRMEEVEQVFTITADGQIAEDKQVTDEFKRIFKHIFKQLPEMMAVFASLPGQSDRRENGIYEIEPGRILLASTGLEFYLILVKKGTEYNAVANRIKQILQI